MLKRLFTAILAVVAIAGSTQVANAQYMFLDTNGDGVRTAADALVVGANTVNVYLDSNHNRNGSTAVCDFDGATPLDISSYYINLSGTNVTYTPLTNQMGTSFSIHFALRNTGDGTLQDGYGSQTASAQGLYKLASLTITAGAGASVNIVDVIPASPVADFTNFGTPCIGNDFDNTYKLAGPGGGSDWTDADGLTIAGPANSPPVLGAIGNKTVNELQTLSFTATATDADAGQTLTFLLDAGAPAGASISAGGAFTWTPTEAQGPGDYPITVRVNDSFSPTPGTDFETIQVHVNEVNVAPVITNPGNKTVNELALLSFSVTATDADVPAQTLTFSLGAGAPAGAAITAGGAFTWTPTEAQGPGSFPITINVSDGVATVGTSITVQVNEVNQNLSLIHI